jgi:hypothetical protein
LFPTLRRLTDCKYVSKITKRIYQEWRYPPSHTIFNEYHDA